MNDTIEAVLQRVTEAWDAHDMEAFGEAFAPNADFVNIFGQWLRGRDAIVRDHAARHAAMFRTARLAMERPTIRAVRPDVALVHWHWRMHDVRGADGNIVGDKAGLMLQVFERHAGRWWVVASHNTETPL
jgi:uncharacterized protein (TIGR02246 family)